MFTREQLAVYAVVDVGMLRACQVPSLVSAIATTGVSMVQLRHKQGSARAVVALARHVHGILAPRGIPLLLNDAWPLVVESGVDGVHLGQDDGDIAEVRAALGPDKIIGRSIDFPEEADARHDYHGLGPIFATTTKSDAGPVVGLGQLRAWRHHIPGPVVAIGGISVENAAAVVAAGADGVAVVGAVCAAADPAAACRQLRAAVETGRLQQTRDLLKG